MATNVAAPNFEIPHKNARVAGVAFGSGDGNGGEESGPLQLTIEFLDSLYAQVHAGNQSIATDSVIEHIDQLLNDGMFAVCDGLLQSVQLDRLPSSIRRAFLMITHPAKDKLPSRNAFYEAALKLLCQEKGEPMAKKMLQNLA